MVFGERSATLPLNDHPGGTVSPASPASPVNSGPLWKNGQESHGGLAWKPLQQVDNPPASTCEIVWGLPLAPEPSFEIPGDILDHDLVDPPNMEDAALDRWQRIMKDDCSDMDLWVQFPDT